MTTDTISVEEGVVFGAGGERDLRCDVVSPAGADNAPAVLVLHGGGWRGGSRDRVRDHCLALARRGFVAVAGEYRLTPESPWPAQIHDVKANIRWMRANAASLGLDPNRIAAEGNSAGAQLALLAAGTPGSAEFEGSGGNPGVSSALQAVVALFPPVLFHVDGEKPSGSVPGAGLLGGTATAEAARDASPITHVSATFPPTFLLHGTADRLVPPSASMRMYEALSAAGAPVEMKMYHGVPHEFVRLPSMMDEVHAEIASFFRRVMVEKDAFNAELDEFNRAWAAMRQGATAAR